VGKIPAKKIGLPEEE